MVVVVIVVVAVVVVAGLGRVVGAVKHETRARKKEKKIGEMDYWFDMSKPAVAP